MADPRTVRVVTVLGGAHSPPETMFVGGCVRNTLLGLDAGDIDLATLHRPIDVMKMLDAHGIRTVPTGLEHGTVTALCDGMTFEVTTLRKDVDTDGRRAVIAFSDNWSEDALRRDFTVNTLLATLDGMVFDPTGEGLRDIDLKRIVFVGDPSERIREDYLRILRFFRFHAAYGEGEPDTAALEACKNYADKTSLLSKERVTQEFLRILALRRPDKALSPLFAAGVLDAVGRNYNADVMNRLCDIQDRHRLQDVLTRLGVIVHKDVPGIYDRLSLSNAQKKKLEHICAVSAALDSLTVRKIREMVYRFGNAEATQGYFLKKALKGLAPQPEIIDIAKYWQAPVFPVKAEQLMAAGIVRGPDLGKKLKALEEGWIKSDFQKVPKF